MPALTLTYNGRNGKPHDWNHVYLPLTQIVTLLNVTKLDYYNVQTYGLRTSNMRMHNGPRDQYIRVYNNSGAGMSQFDLVSFNDYLYDGTDEYPKVELAYADNAAQGTRWAHAMLIEDIANGAAGTAAFWYERVDIDTSSYHENQLIWLDDENTKGGYRFTLPSPNYRTQAVGYVVHDHATEGRLMFNLPGQIIPYNSALEVL